MIHPQCFEKHCVVFSVQSVRTHWPLKTKTQRLSETSGPPHPTAQSHIPEDLNPQQQQHYCENPEKLQKTKTSPHTQLVITVQVVWKANYCHQDMKATGVLEISLYEFLNSTPNGGALFSSLLICPPPPPQEEHLTMQWLEV